jgi:hypothetical protein
MAPKHDLALSIETANAQQTAPHHADRWITVELGRAAHGGSVVYDHAM